MDEALHEKIREWAKKGKSVEEIYAVRNFMNTGGREFIKEMARRAIHVCADDTCDNVISEYCGKCQRMRES